MEPGASFQFGSRKHGIRIGLSSESAQYRLNHRINVWQCLETEKHFPDGHHLMSGDPLFDDSLLFVTNPDGTITKVGFGGGPIDGPPGVGWMGGCSDFLHSIIRKRGTYKLQWKTADLESGVITFTIIP
ncbi:MAG: hypothetical protein QOD99_2912 [Chthoniobacter sp.]|nr:hypothetical protein [Chthoniobacter sp.]